LYEEKLVELKKNQSSELERKKSNPTTGESLKIEEENKEEEKRKAEQDFRDPEFEFQSRYFLKNPSITCRRCGESGHYERNCPVDIKKTLHCLFCLGEHSTDKCRQFICFNCLQPGHKSMDCEMASNHNKTCFQCNKKGHFAKNCGVLVPNCSREDSRAIFCLKCKQKGHINCNEFQADDLFPT